MNRNLTKSFQAVFLIGALALCLIVLPCDLSWPGNYSFESHQTVIESVQHQALVGKFQSILCFQSVKQKK